MIIVGLLLHVHVDSCVCGTNINEVEVEKEMRRAMPVLSLSLHALCVLLHMLCLWLHVHVFVGCCVCCYQPHGLSMCSVVRVCFC